MSTVAAAHEEPIDSAKGRALLLEDIADYVSDVANTIALAKSRNPGLPVYLLGHNAGGVVSATRLDERLPVA